MAVTINKTDGTVLTTIQDGDIDITSTNLALIGRLYRNYGELVNENFVKLLENFANSSSPTNPIIGQLWYNTTNGIIHVYRSTGFIGLASLTTSAAQPNLPRQSDLWYDTVDAQLKLYTGTAWVVVAPAFTSTQGKTGIFVETLRDILSANHICIVHYQQNNVVAVHCRDPQWTPQASIAGLPVINPGFNLSSSFSQQFHGTATNAANLANIPAASYLRNDVDGILDGSLTLNTSLKIGELEDFVIENSGSQTDVTKPDGGINFKFGLDTALSIDDAMQVKLSDGSESTPSLSFIEDTNTGMYRAGANAIGFSVGSTNIVEINEFGLTVNGEITANNFTGILNADSIIADNTTTSNLTVTANTTLGTTATNTVNIRARNINIPNGLIFSTANVQFNGVTKFADSITSDDGIAPITVDTDLYVTGDTEIEGGLVVNGTINVGGILIGDSNGRLLLNSAVATGYANVGDFSMGETNGIRSYNSPKMWIAFNGTLAGLAIYDSFNIDFVTRTSTNNYTFTTEYPISSGAMAVIGTNGTLLAAAPSIGATSFSITTTSEGTRMALVVLSQ